MIAACVAVLTLAATLSCSRGQLLLPPEREDVLGECLTRVVLEYFGGRDVAYVLDKEAEDLVSESFDKVVIESGSKTSLKVDLENIVFLSGNGTRLVEHIEHLKRNDLWDPPRIHQQKILIVAEKTSSLEEISEVFLRNDVLIYVVLVYGGAQDVRVYHWESHFCRRNPKVVTAGTCTGRFVEGTQKKNFAGCRLKAVVLNKDNVFPFVQDISSDRPGLFVDVVRTVAQMENFSLTYLMASKEETSKFIRDGETVLFEKMLTNRTVDIFVAAYSIGFRKFVMKMEFSEIFYAARNLWMVPRKKQVSFEAIVNILTINLKIMIAVLILVSFVVCYVGEKALGKYPVHLLWFLGSLLENTGRTKSKSKSVKIVLSLFMLQSLIFVVAFKAKLSSVLLEPAYDDEIDTIEELADSNFTLFAKKATIESVEELSDADPVAKKLLKRMRASPPVLFYADLFKTLVKHRNLSTTIDEHIWRLLPKKARSSLKVIEPPNYLLERQSVFVTRKGHPVLKNFNTVIDRMHQAGLVKKYVDQMHHPRISSYMGLEDKDDELTPLNVGHFEGVFFIYLVGLAASLCSFVGEVILPKLVSCV
jgi:hypothetical protein